jgi:hypothetical protein
MRGCREQGRGRPHQQRREGIDAPSELVALLGEAELHAETDLGVAGSLLHASVVEPLHRFTQRLPTLTGACRWLAQRLVDKTVQFVW